MASGPGLEYVWWPGSRTFSGGLRETRYCRQQGERQGKPDNLEGVSHIAARLAEPRHRIAARSRKNIVIMKLSQGTEKSGVLIRLVENFSKRNLKETKGLMRSPRGQEITNWSHLHECARFFEESSRPRIANRVIPGINQAGAAGDVPRGQKNDQLTCRRRKQPRRNQP
jgi:sarcosine oxidase delta subunit